MAAHAVNPLEGDPPHVLVVDRVDLDDDEYPYDCYIECPFPLVEVRRFEEYREPHRIIKMGHLGHHDPSDDPVEERVESVRGHEHRGYMHAGWHYCTMAWRPPGQMKPEPTMTFYLRWQHPGDPLDVEPHVLAKVEVNPRYWVNGGCFYDEVASQAGLIEAIVGWRAADRLRKEPRSIPPPLPTEPGKYPIYYWSDGYGEGFEDGFTFDVPSPVTEQEYFAELDRRQRMEVGW